MASKKFTDLPVASTADSEDILAIVDVSTDTSKQITKEDFYVGLIPQGAFTPTVSNESGVNGVDVSSASYIDFGSYVQYHVKCDVNYDVAGVSGSFDIDVPVNSAFNVPRTQWCAQSGSQSANVMGVSVQGSAPNIITVEVNPSSGAVSSQNLDIIIVYLKS